MQVVLDLAVYYGFIFRCFESFLLLLLLLLSFLSILLGFSELKLTNLEIYLLLSKAITQVLATSSYSQALLNRPQRGKHDDVDGFRLRGCWFRLRQAPRC